MSINELSFKQKLVISFLIISVMLGIIAVFIMERVWIFSLLGGCLSYVLLMVITFYSIRTKIIKKILEADTEQKLLKYASKYDNINDVIEVQNEQDSKQNIESSNNHNKNCNIKNQPNKEQDNIKTEGKERLKFIDLSKASLGFELSFSMPRIFAFLGMILCFGILVWFNVFFPIVYLFGVFLGVVLVVCGLLAIKLHNHERNI